MAFSYIGGKSRIGKWIKDYIPFDIETYLEPFGGAFWVYYNIEHEHYNKLNNVVYNDFNPLNTNLHLCIKNHAEFIGYIKDIPAQEKDRFIEYQNNAFNTDFEFNGQPDYQKGLEYIYVVTQVFSGSKPETSNFIDLKGKYNSKFNSFRNKLTNPKWTKMFDSINNFENLDFGEVIEKYDSEKSYIYLDPPYYKTENYYSNHDFDNNDHERLANVLQNVKGKFALSYYYFPQLEEWFPRDQYVWVEKDFAKAASATKGKVQNKGKELLIMNYEL
jgi:DNA adenine methylase